MEITMQPIRRYKNLLDGAIIFSDILVIPQAFEMEEMEEMIKKPLDEKILMNKLGYVYEAIELTIEALESEIPLIGFVGAPWTLFAYMTSGGSTGVSSSANKVSGLSGSKATSFDVAKNWLFEQTGSIKAGCQLGQVFDSWAGELSPFDFKRFSLPYLRRVSDMVKEDLQKSGIEPVPLIVFAKGANQADHLRLLSESGYSTIGLDWKVDASYVIDSLGQNSTRVALQGNLDPAVLHSSHESIRSYVRRMFDTQHGGFRGDLPHIANLGHGITPGVDPELMKTFLESVHEEGRKARQKS
ncbi:Uroporphyrinogen decarboxylase [Phakopsora pachyrhizi]|nr:Uroporphyrinogen decarboxylase [Phakopsora pachyrhizi]